MLPRILALIDQLERARQGHLSQTHQRKQRQYRSLITKILPHLTMSSSHVPAKPDEDVVDVSIVSSPCDPGSVPGLLDKISQMRDNCDALTDRSVRLELLNKARALVQALETPRETMLKHCGAQVRGFIVQSMRLGSTC